MQDCRNSQHGPGLRLYRTGQEVWVQSYLREEPSMLPVEGVVAVAL